jgi:hypothetical protein
VATESTVLYVALLVEEDADEARRIGWPTETKEEVRKAVLAAVAVLLRDRPHARVEWSSLTSIPLDGKPGFGRCAVCNRWVYDVDEPSEPGAGAVSRGAKVVGSGATSIYRRATRCVSQAAGTTVRSRSRSGSYRPEASVRNPMSQQTAASSAASGL